MTKVIRPIVFAYFLFIFFASCKHDVSMESGKVKDTLTEYGNQHKETEVVLHTSMGNISLRLYNETPLHRANFIRLISNQYYSDGIFYRILDGFCVQGGNPPNMKRPDYTIPMEILPQYVHKRGALAMASELPGVASSGTEFYIVTGTRMTQLAVDELKENGVVLSLVQVEAYTSLGGNYSLDGHYTVFGEVVKGLDVVEKIAAVKIFDGEKPLEKITFSVEVK